MKINLDRNSPIPVGVQIKEQIRMFINSGVYKYGEKLSSISDLASGLEVNKNTVVTALKSLESEGYIKCQKGKGAFVVWKNPNTNINEDIINRIDGLVREAGRKKIGLNEILNLVNIRYTHAGSDKVIRALFVMGVGKSLLEQNIKRLREKVKGVVFEGIFVSGDTLKENIEEAFERADMVIVPGIIYEHYRPLFPEHRHIVRTMPDLKELSSLKRGVEKKSKIAVIGSTRSGAQILSEMFISEGMFKPKMVLSINEAEKYKKELKEMDSFVICMSAVETIDKIKLKLKDKNVYFFSDYVSEESMNNIKMYLKKINMKNFPEA